MFNTKLLHMFPLLLNLNIFNFIGSFILFIVFIYFYLFIIIFF